MDRAAGCRPNRTQFVHRLANDIDDAAKTFVATGTMIGEPVSVTFWPR